MGCASSVQVKKNEVSVAKSLDENFSSDKNEKDLHEDSLHQNKGTNLRYSLKNEHL